MRAYVRRENGLRIAPPGPQRANCGTDQPAECLGILVDKREWDFNIVDWKRFSATPAEIRPSDELPQLTPRAYEYIPERDARLKHDFDSWRARHRRARANREKGQQRRKRF